MKQGEDCLMGWWKKGKKINCKEGKRIKMS
jgi:hypothetical protein